MTLAVEKVRKSTSTSQRGNSYRLWRTSRKRLRRGAALDTEGAMTMDRTDWLLLFLGLPGGPYETDQIRVMKGMFIFSQEGPKDVRRLYDFQPYDYGPFDVQIYHDLEWLEFRGLIRIVSVEDTNRRLYRLTEKGQGRVAELITRAAAPAVLTLRQIKQKVTSLSFIDLLKDVYRRYPKYAAKSVLTK
jgi:DNA-binding PadR family transcriptional regulator